ncbi:MAG: CoA-acylating methylmalonate-semialdehyde dehydrogenase [Peptoniphilaceae bacterium]|nr:CoA-acylating methylmalonate-semialdehyde dehydrogenase [Peptoniphilaceae bacterium]MDY6018362.1 CoA-acylating methylmalonate-semialdehyde dehydrogenase [Anaerococcus sp.]
MKKIRNYVNGEWKDSKTEEFLDVYNPGNGKVIGKCPLSTQEETKEAIEAAAKTFESWSKVPVTKRAKILFKLQNILVDHQDELADLITEENGKNHSDAYGEVGRGIENVEHAASIVNLLMGDSLSTIATDVDVTNYKYPIGVIGCICPFNFPMMVPFWMFPMAIACGNTVVLKPSEKTPILTQRIIELCEEAGLPKGVLNVVNGGSEVVNEILVNPNIVGVSFVGSKNVGEYVYHTASAHNKRVQVLGGAKNHTVILKDCDMEDTIKKVIGGAFGSAGQRCMAGSVILVENEIADEFVEKFTLAAKKLKIGDASSQSDVDLGPVIRKEAQERTFNYIQSGVDQGATLVLDGRKNIPSEGFFVGPTILDNCTTEMKVWKDEIFAPVVSIIRVKNLKSAIDIAKKHELANGACLFTNNAKAIRYFRENIPAGMIGINLGVPAPVAFYSFSGWKNSFYGDLHANGKDAVYFYTRRKVVTAQLRTGGFEE